MTRVGGGGGGGGRAVVACIIQGHDNFHLSVVILSVDKILFLYHSLDSESLSLTGSRYPKP